MAASPQNVRPSASFAFYKNGTRFMPAAGTRIHFANRDTDTLVMPGLDAGLLAAGDKVSVMYRSSPESGWTTVFTGTVEKIVDSHTRGDTRLQTVTCEGPWGKMNRLVFRQTWSANTSLSFSSARVILNQDPLGSAMTLNEQLAEIASFAADKCGFSAPALSTDSIYLPNDETRDMTCASAIQRELRFFPKRIVRFDYAQSIPRLVIEEPSESANAPYIAEIPKTQRTYEYNAHPITAVDVYTDHVAIETGDESFDSVIRSQTHQIYPQGADINALDVMHCYIQLAPGSASTSYKTLESDTEDIPSNLNAVWWWKYKHPRLANVNINEIEITDAQRSNTTYPRIARNTAAELRQAGLNSTVCTFTCKAKITTSDDVEENIVLTMDFLTTDARTRSYTWQTGSSSMAGELLPEGLAKALYDQRASALLNERITIRLGATFPVLGDKADGLYLQSFDVDCDDLTAELNFGQPDHLSAEDMRDLLSGFRQRGYAENAASREDGEPETADDVGSIRPLSSTEFCPGSKIKTTFHSSTGGNKVIIDSQSVTEGTMSVRQLKIKTADGEEQTLQFLSTSDATVSGDGKDENENDSDDANPCTHPTGGTSVMPWTDGVPASSGAGSVGGSVDGEEGASGGTTAPGCDC